MSLKKIENALKPFLAKHSSETFYLLKIDANYIGLKTEERFETARVRKATEWDQEHAPLTLEQIKQCDAEQLEDDHWRIHSATTGSAAISLEQAVLDDNTRRAEARAQGNPYQSATSKQTQQLRWGNTATYGELVELGFEKEYQAHYKMDDEAQKTSPYARAVATVIAELEAARDTLFAGVKVAPDFKIVSAEHGY